MCSIVLWDYNIQYQSNSVKLPFEFINMFSSIVIMIMWAGSVLSLASGALCVYVDAAATSQEHTI